MNLSHKIGAIPFNITENQCLLMLITSRTRERLIFPKGNKDKKESRKKTCKREAFEEAGIIGKVFKRFPITQRISKSQNGKLDHVCVTYYPMFVLKQFDEWPESSKRQRHWATLEDAQKVTDREDFLKVIQIFTDLKPLILDIAGRKKEKRQAQPTQAR